MIYFIESNKGLINIGKASKARKILYYLRRFTSNPEEKFDLIGEIDGSDADLEEICKIFIDLRSHRDWYHADDSLIRFIERLCSKKQ